MPNVRKKGKVMLGGYVPKDLGDEVEAEAERLGLTKKDLVEKIIRDYLKAKGATK